MLRALLYCFCISLVCASPLTRSISGKTHLKDIDDRIVNGDEAALGQFPWQVALYFLTENATWFCGGSILTPIWILTAGHCVDGATYVYVWAGLVDFADPVQNIILGDTFVLHEEYNPSTGANDIGLVFLWNEIQFDSTKAPIALPSQPLEAGVEITVSGWGARNDTNETITLDILRYITVATIANSECAAVYGEAAILDEFVCAAAGSNPVKSPCTGDSGGPAVQNAATDPVLVAVVNFVSDTGCESGNPSGYVRTEPYIDWIQDKIGV